MPTNDPDFFAALCAPFDRDEVKVRSQSGRQFFYVTARTVMNRLDNVAGPENWWDEYIPSENSVLCRLTLRLPAGTTTGGTTLTKCDAGGYAGMADQGDDDKSGYSDAFKRAAVKFGVGRYLYRDGVPIYAQSLGPGEVPEGVPEPQHEPPQARPDRPANGQASGFGDKPPRSGKALFAWTKQQEQEHGVALLSYINSWAKLQDYPGRMVDWDAEQVALAHAEAVRKLHSVSTREPGEEG